jgi:NAD(P)-dependent dehydrogenase (short-subunit alcohol dehydrogenase family)
MMVSGQHIVVIGGSSGIGFAVADAVAREGARVTIAARDPERLEAARQALGANAAAHRLDVRSEEAVQGFFEAIGDCDHCVYTAGDDILQQAIVDTDIEAAHRFFDVRFWGAALVLKHGARSIRPGGSITLTSSTLTVKPVPGFATGAAVVAAIEGLTRSAAVELAPIRVNAISAGVVRTPLWDRIPAEHRDAFFEAHGAALPVGQVGKASEVAEGFLFFMRSAYATGQVLIIDGGHVLV